MMVELTKISEKWLVEVNISEMSDFLKFSC